MSEDKFSEADLCAEFRAYLEKNYGAAVHPEVKDWDMVAVLGKVGQTEIPFGAHLGIQAKLLANVEVLYQAAVQHRIAPRFRCVLVRRASSEFIDLAAHLGLMVAVREFRRSVFGRKSVWYTAEEGFKLYGSPRDFGSKQFQLPPVVTSMPAGSRSPKQLTPWKVKALGLCRLAAAQGYLTTEDFKRAGVDMRRWVTCRWIVKTDMKAWVAPFKKGKAEGVLVHQYNLGPRIGEITDGWEQVSKDLAEVDAVDILNKGLASKINWEMP